MNDEFYRTRFLVIMFLLGLAVISYQVGMS